MLAEAAAQLDRDKASARTLLAHASALLIAEVKRGRPEYTSPPRGGLTGWQMKCVKVFIAEHIAESIHVEKLSKIANLSRPHFHRAFKKSCGESPHLYIVGQRLALARQLMLTEEMALRDVALESGFSDQPHLSRVFRHWMGKSPAAWRREHRKVEAVLQNL